MEAAAVALLGQVARELVHEQPPVREDQHAGRAGRLDEAGRRDGLAGRGRMLEAVAPTRARVGRLRLAVQSRIVIDGRHRGVMGEGRLLAGVVRDLVVVVVLVLIVVVLVLVLVVLVLVVLVGLVVVLVDGGLGLVAVLGLGLVVVLLVGGGGALEVADQRGELAGEGVDLVAAQRRARRQLRLRIGEHPLEPEHERVVAAPLVARLHAGPRAISSRAASSALRRTVPGASATAISSPSWRSGSPHHASTRCAAASESASKRTVIWSLQPPAETGAQTGDTSGRC